MKNKNLFAFVSAIAMTFSLCAVMPSAAETDSAEETGKCGENLYYSLDKETGTLHITGTGDMFDKKIQQDYASEVCIDMPGNYGFFSHRDDIVSVIIDDGASGIGLCAFEKCSSLTSVTLPESLTIIESMAFSNSWLTEITIPDTVTGIGNRAFEATPWLEERRTENPLVVVNDILIDGATFSGDAVIPDGVEIIGADAFYGNENLTSAELPASVLEIGYSAFKNCENLESVSVPGSVSFIDSSAFFGCRNLKSFTIPEKLTTINDGTFYHCDSLKTITIPENITRIDGTAFCGCDSLESVVIPASVESIGNNAFFDCPSLESVTILNPDCDIFQSPETILNKMIRYKSDSSVHFTAENTLTIYGYENSTAQKYAEMYDYNFETIGVSSQAEIYGDVNGDGMVNIADTVVLQKWLLGSGGLSDWKNADLCKDGRIDIFDMIEMRRLIINS